MYFQVIKSLFLVALLFLISPKLNAQYETNASNLIVNKCGQCHNNSRSSPFSLLSHADILRNIKMIEYVIQENVMPPVVVDTSFVHFSNVIVLNQSEKDLIFDWIKMDCPEQEIYNNLPIVKKFKGRKIKLKLKTSRLIENISNDQFNYKIIKLPIKDSLIVSGYYYNIKNNLLHHTELLELMPLSTIKRNTIFNTNSYELNTEGLSIDRYLFGWFPGSNIGLFPKGTGVKIYGNKKTMLISHYSQSLEIKRETSDLVLEILPAKTAYREIYEFAIHGTANHIHKFGMNAPFIKANEIKEFEFTEVMESDASVFGVYFHAHHLCKEMVSYAITPDNDTINLLKIDRWDFEKQYTYRYDNFLYLEAGTKIYCKAKYDNSSENFKNPSNPPVDVLASFFSKDEMFEFFLLYLDYREGDKSQKIEY